MEQNIFIHIIRKAADWFFRVATIERFMITSAFSVIIAIFAGKPILTFLVRIFFGTLPEKYSTTIRTVDAMSGWILILCYIVIVIAILIIIWRLYTDNRSAMRKRVLVVEGRGLRDDDGSPLDKAVAEEIPGQCISLLLDLRNSLDGKIIEPEKAILKIAANHQSIIQHCRSVDRSDLTIVYGGLTSVPYTFLTGVYFDDESSIITFDWDRKMEKWRNLLEGDDEKEFKDSGFHDVRDSAEVVLALSYSYPIVDEDLLSTFCCPVVRMTLDGQSSDAHWSETKQNRLAQQFFEKIKQLKAISVKRIHLVMAAPNSVVFTFGRRYDR